MTSRVRGFLVSMALLLLPITCLGQARFDKAEYFKSAAAGQKKGGTLKGELQFDSAQKTVQFLGAKEALALSVKYDAIKSMLYERTSKPRYAAGLLIAWPLLFTKSKSHYLTIQYDGPGGTGQYAVIRLHKDNYRDVLAKAEAETGKKVERMEER
jgi:hypothetical protein